MRYELQAILWVSTCLFAVASFFFDAHQPSELASSQIVSLPAAVSEGSASESVGSDSQSDNEPFEDLRPIFRSAAVVTLPTPMPQASGSEEEIFLRGLVESSAGSKALVANREQTYALLAVGQEAFGQVLVEIGADRVVLRDRETSILTTVMLRGTNESPE